MVDRAVDSTPATRPALLERMKPGLICVAASVLTGLLLAASMPPADFGFLAWVAFVPMLVAATRVRPLEAVGLAFVSGMTFAVTIAGVTGGDRLFWGYTPFFSFTAMAGVLAAVVSIARRRFTGARWVFGVACAGVALELATHLLPIPYNLALSQYRVLDLIQLVSVTGIWGVSFLLWLANAALAESVLARKVHGAVWLVAALVLATVGWGTHERARLAGEPRTFLSVAAIQDCTGEETPCVSAPVDDPWHADRDVMTKVAAADGAKLVVWSEEVLGSAFAPKDPKDETRKLARNTGTSLVVGYSSSDLPKPYNCAAFVGSTGDTLGVYHKCHLYLGEAQATKPGRGASAVQTPLGPIGMEICFDSCYGDVTRELVASGAKLVAMPNYDPPTPRGVLHDLHTTMMPFRAVENRVPFVRCDSNGESMIVQRDGSITARGPLYRSAIVEGVATLGDGKPTVYTRFGDWLAYLCVVGSLALLLSRPEADVTSPSGPSQAA